MTPTAMMIAICLVAVATRRYLRASASTQGHAAEAPLAPDAETADVT